MSGQLIGHTTSEVFTGTTEGKTHELGAVSEDHEGKRWLFVQASEAIAQYDAVAVSEAFAAAKLGKTEADDGWKIGVAPVALAANEYGWVQIYGPATVKVLGSCAADVVLYTSGTDGALDDTSTSQTKIAGIIATAAAGTTSATTVAAYMGIEPFAAL